MQIQNPNLKKIRKENQKKTLLLLKKDSCYCKDIAQSIGVSNVAMYDILEDFKSKNIVSTFTPDDSGLGRKPAKYCLNKYYGNFIALDFTPPCVKLCLHNIFGEIFAQKKYPFENTVDLSFLEMIVSEIKRLLQDYSPELPLRNICISTPGRIDPDTGFFTVAAIFKNAHEINLQQIFENVFHCPVLVKNNMYLAFNGEINKYRLYENNDMLYFYIAESLGGAIYLDGKIRNGFNNLSGEIAFSTSFDLQPISTLISPSFVLKSYKQLLLEDLLLPAAELEKCLQYTVDDLIALYKQGDPFAVKTFHSAMEKLAVLINNLQSMLDCSVTVINSYFYYCGEKLQTELADKLAELSRPLPLKRKILFTEPDNQLFIDGCIHYAIDKNIIATLQLDN